MGFGLIVGPIIGSALYSTLGYAMTFFIYGGFLIILSVVVYRKFSMDEEADPIPFDQNTLLSGQSEDINDKSTLE